MLSENLTNIIMQLLRDYEIVKDDDQYLVAMVWRKELEKTPPTTNYGLLGMIARHELTHFESIRRIRQKLQEEYPELRGKNYDKRHAHQEVVKEQLKGITPQQKLL